MVALSFASLLQMPLRAQDPLFTQYYHSPLYTNPGLTGTGEHEFRVCANMRLQWHNVPSVMRYGTLSVDGYNERYSIGGGILLNHFNEGYLRTTSISGLFSRQFGDYEESRVFASIGVQAGFTWRGINTRKLLFADEIGVEGPLPGAMSEADRLNFNDKPFFDMSCGGVLTWQNWMVGAAWHHITQPYNNLIGFSNSARLPARYSASLSKIIPLSRDQANPSWLIKPSVMYSQQLLSRFVALGAMVEAPDLLSFGFWYRNNAGFINNHSISFGVNISLGQRTSYMNGSTGKKSRLGLSYDIEVNRPGPRATAGSSELGYLFEYNLSGSKICPKPYNGEDLKKYPWAFQ